MIFAVMQPYLFPYLGYYQLVNAVDKFVFYDDVTFIKGGYINRNNILSNGKSQRFTIPVPGMSSNKLINTLEFDPNVKKILKSIEQNYKKAPYFYDIFPVVESILNNEDRNVANMGAKSICAVFDYLGIEKDIYFTSELEYEREQSAADRLISISKLLRCSEYINSPGGIELYKKQYFEKSGVNLSFIKMDEISYFQGGDTFVPYLSMIDILMWNNKAEVVELLSKYKLV